MAENGKITVLDGEVHAGFGQYIRRQLDRGKNPERTLKYVMKIWLDFAWGRVPKGDKARIRADLMQIVVAYRRAKTKRARSAVQQEYSGTLADRIVQKLNYGNVRAMKGAERYRVVRSFVNARVFAANHHRAGFYPAYRYLRKNAEDTSGPRYAKHPSGTARGDFRDTLAEILVENFASAAPVPGRPPPLGMSGLAGEAFEAAMPEVAEMFARFVREDSIKQGQLAGFTVASFG